MSFSLHQNSTPRAAHSRVHYGNMHGPLREIAPALRQQKRRSQHIKSRHLMRQVYNRHARCDSRNDALHHTHKVIRRPKVCQESNHFIR